MPAACHVDPTGARDAPTRWLRRRGRVRPSARFDGEGGALFEHLEARGDLGWEIASVDVPVDVRSLGNVPITIGGLPIRNLLSFQYASRYFLNGGALHCEDMRAGCP
jgi:hypothetical protein